MRAAIYARFSTEKQRPVSIEDQFRECERTAHAAGLEIVARFEDKGISGGTARRPGYQALLAAARRREFEVIVSEDISRLWRNRAEFGPRSAELEDLGIHWVSCVGQDTRRDGWGVTVQVLLAMAEQGRREASYRARRGHEGLALAGKSAGGRAYSYIPAALSGTGETEIDQQQAAVVLRIFELYATGVSPRNIAARLNAEGVPSPGATWKRTTRRTDGKWLASAIHGDVKRGSGILNNRRYIGVITWGRTEWKRSAADSSVRRVKVLDQARVERTDERLRIIPQALWNRVKSRQAHQRKTVGARVKRGLRRPGGGRAPRHLLSGLLRCAVCGAAFTLADARAYACASHVNGDCCTNHIRVRRTLAEERILASIKRDLRDPAVLTEVERRVSLALAQRAKAPRCHQGARIAELERQIANFVKVIGAGEYSPALSAALKAAELELAHLSAERQPRTAVIARVMPKARERFLGMVDDLGLRLDQDTEHSRPALIEAIGDRIEMHPDASGRFLWAEYGLEGERLLASLGVPEIMVAGAGFEPATFGL